MSEFISIRQTCRLCDSSDLVCSVPLVSVPIVSPNVGTETDGAGARITRVTAPLDTYMCRSCGLIQLIHVVEPSLIYQNYHYRTSVSLGLAEHFRALADTVSRRIMLVPRDHVVEFGSNDGTLLRFFKDKGAIVTGVDPAKEIAAEATHSGIPTSAEFFGETVANRIRREIGPARIIVANNAMANIDGLDDVLRGVASLLADDGVFVFETQYALDVFEKMLLDVIYHEHISCFSVTPIVNAVRRFGLQVIDAERIPTKGGSIRFWLARVGGPYSVAARVGDIVGLEGRIGLHDLEYHSRFVARVASLKRDLQTRTAQVKEAGGHIGAYGTSVGCAALIHQFELEDVLDMLFDDSPFKNRIEGPGYNLPVYRGDALARCNPALTIVLAWRYAEVITSKHADYIDRGGKFIVPLPKIRIIPE